MNLYQTATLCVSSSDTNCISNSHKTSFTWSGINLRMLLGNAYNQYDYFNLVLCSVLSENANTGIGTTIEDLSVITKISGFPFINQTYNISTGNNTSYAPLVPLNFTRGESLVMNGIIDIVLTFNKQQEVVDLNIFYERFDHSDVSTSNDYPNILFLFKIVGVKQNDELINHKMKI